ncbi:tetratricopeptide repeat protein [Marivita sp. GX14005]|uniref:tetratricopeptide repeat protein n=1 Tax=Marivita sp. GX14005 TaxID=2942276 RepID=UPI00201A1611|nr:tetratricopeptide repeat protein [Marivita sp. GX14005]MCL3881820.1 tetratricopeptide repeat protein [Marivita sp. GX14005]
MMRWLLCRHIAMIALLGFAFASGAGAGTLSGDYLAGRQASFDGDIEAAARHYGRAIMHDPENPTILERAALAEISLGNIPRAAELAVAITGDGQRSQVAHMALVAQTAADQDYATLAEMLSDQRGVGPLVDGLLLAWATLGTGDMSAALGTFDEIAAQQGMRGFALYHKAIALASVGDFEGAVTILDQAGASGMQMTRRGVMAHAEMLSQLERNEEALALLDQVFGQDLDPGLRDMKSALEAGTAMPFTHIRSAKDGLAEVFYTLAAALATEANDEFTLLYARVAEYLRPNHVDAILLTAGLLDDLGQSELAVKAYGRVPVDHPAYHAAELGRAAALSDSDKTDAAIEVLERLSKTHASEPVVHSTLGDMMRRLERYEDAVSAYSRALELVEKRGDTEWFLHYARAISYERIGNWDKAEADFRAALELNPEQPQVLNYLGYSLVEKQIKLDEALDMIERAAAARPESGYIMDSLGWVLYRLGRYEEAVTHMERAAELMPVDPVVNDHLGDVYWAVGRKTEARFQWRRALSFASFGTNAEEVDPDRIRAKLSAGLDKVLADEGKKPLQVANGSSD